MSRGTMILAFVVVGVAFWGLSASTATSDVDGDRLPDEWENASATDSGAALPNSNAQKMDLYVQINYGKGIEPLSNREKRELKEIWAEMPVENPNGDTGITIHINDSPPHGGEVEEYLKENFDIVLVLPPDLVDEHKPDYTEYIAPGRECVYHLALFMWPQNTIPAEYSETVSVGRGDAPGYLVKIDGTTRDVEGEYSYRPRILTHELLHNIVGEIDNSTHTDDGWLSHNNDEYLSKTVSDRLNKTGFNESEYYDYHVC